MTQSATDIDIVRWAYVEVLKLSPEFTSAVTDRERQLVADRVLVGLVSAAPEELQKLLRIDDPIFAERVFHAIKANEASRTGKH